MSPVKPPTLKLGSAAAALVVAAQAAQAGAQDAPATASATTGAIGTTSTTSTAERWRFGAVLDATVNSRAPLLATRDQGLQLGHSDLTAAGPLGRHFHAQLGAVLATHEGRVEKAIEEAWVESRTLPLGLTARVGRFASQIGQLNQQHPHADDFVDRPLLHRALLGGHWNDDGARLNITLPTAMYWMLGAEVFRGHRLVPEAERAISGPSAFTLTSKLGGDLGRSNSWQLGLSHLHSRRTAAQDGEDGGQGHGHGHEESDGHAHHHHHGAQFGGRRTWLADATWKWAPGGNNRERQLRVTLEAARTTGINRFARAGDRHEAAALAAVWRWHPHWEIGARTDRLRVAMPHGDHFHRGRLAEHALMVAWKPSHQQVLRLQATRQADASGFESPVRRALQLQYVLAFGAHGAHSY